MTDIQIDYEIAILLKKKNIKVRCKSYFENGIIKHKNKNKNIIDWDYNTSFLNVCSRPTYTQLYTYLKDKYKLETIMEIVGLNKYIYTIIKNDVEIFKEEIENNIEETLKFVLLETLNNI